MVPLQRKQAAWRPASREVSGGLSEKVKLKTKPEGGGGSGPESLVRLSRVLPQGQVQQGVVSRSSSEQSLVPSV